jgi:hypothetical protein
MKRLMAALLLIAVTIALASPAAADSYRYRTLGPLSLSIGGSRTTVDTDSLARNFNTALSVVDSTLVYDFPIDIAWGGATDSLPLMVLIERVGGTGGSTDTVQVALDVNYGGNTFPVAGRSASAPAYFWGFSTVALVGAGTGGVAVFKPGVGGSSASEKLNAISTYTGIPGYAGRRFRVLARSFSVAASAGRFSLYLLYPTQLQY